MSQADKSKKEQQRDLDAALKDTFPASDPVANGEASASEPDRPLDRRPAKLDVGLVEELARNTARKHAK